jgi:glucose-1-phosphate adenylyltransferase
LQRGWSFLRGELNETVEVLPAQQRTGEGSWYRGTADAIFQNLDILKDTQTGHDYVIVLPADHVVKMDYSILLREHTEHGGCTVACTEVPLAQARGLGVVSVAQDRRVTAFDEKPQQPTPLPHRPGMAMVSMGIYVFDASYLYALLETAHARGSPHQDFGLDILPRVVAEGRLYAHSFAQSNVSRVPRALGEAPYWRTVSTVDEYWAANLDLAAVIPKLDIYDTDWPIWTDQQQLPPAKFVMDLDGRNGTVVNTIVSAGCVVAGSTIKDCVLFSGVRVESSCDLLEVVLLPNVRVGEGCRLRRAVVDCDCVLPPGLTVGEDPQADARRFERSAAGVVLITRQMLDNA